MVKDNIQQVIDILNENYNMSDIEIITDIDEDSDTGFIQIKDKIYTIYPGLEQSDYENLASYIAADADLLSSIEESITNVSNVRTSEAATPVPAEVLPLDESYPSLLVALDSERDAEITYKTLIDIEKSSDNPNQQVIDLLEKILREEEQHIALLAALQANNNSDFVEEDSQEDFDSYIDEIKEDE